MREMGKITIFVCSFLNIIYSHVTEFRLSDIVFYFELITLRFKSIRLSPMIRMTNDSRFTIQLFMILHFPLSVNSELKTTVFEKGSRVRSLCFFLAKMYNSFFFAKKQSSTDTTKVSNLSAYFRSASVQIQSEYKQPRSNCELGHEPQFPCRQLFRKTRTTKSESYW